MGQKYKVKDLVELKAIQSVIQLTSEGQKKEVYDQFVKTTDIKHYLSYFFSSIKAGEGGGIFLKGHYGSGKSHFLSYLSVLTEIEEENSLDQFFCIRLSLTEWRGDQSLEYIFYHSQNFEPDSSLNRTENIEALLKLIHLKRNKTKLLICIDELSEFLRSKTDVHQLSEDIRFLQFISEYASEHKSWVIGAIQEDIEGLGVASREVSLKLKDRYPIRWDFKKTHLSELIPARLLKHDCSKLDVLNKVHAYYYQLWPTYFTDQEVCVRIYPVHPLTLSFLIHLGQLFSEHRGALKFIEHVLANEVVKEGVTYTEQSCEKLITVDYLFDYFVHRLMEHIDLKEYYSKAWVHLSEKVNELELNEEDYHLAQRMIKVIILSSLDASREGISLDELSCALLFQIADSATITTTYLSEKIIDPLLVTVNYLVEENGLYYVDLQHKSNELLEHLVSQKRESLSVDSLNFWKPIMSIVSERQLDLKKVWEESSLTLKVKWLNSIREMSISWYHSDDETDIQILLPNEVLNEQDEARLYWVPNQLDEKTKTMLLDASIYLQFVEENPQTHIEKVALDEARRIIEASKQQWVETVLDLYKQGDWCLNNKMLQLDILWSQMHSFEESLEEPTYELLSHKHPGFRQVAPKVSFLNERMLTDIVELFVMEERVSESELKSKQLYEIVLAVLKPLGCIDKHKKDLRFIWDFAKSDFVASVENCLEEHKGNVEKLRGYLHEGYYGLDQRHIDFILWCMCVSKHKEAYRHGEKLDSHKLSFYNLSEIEFIKEVSVLNESILNTLKAHPFFEDIDQTYTGLTLQNELWSSFVQKLPMILEVELDINAGLENPELNVFHELFEQKKINVQNCSKLLDLKDLSADEGLSRLSEFKSQLNDLKGLLSWQKEYSSFLKRDASDFFMLRHYIEDESLEELPESKFWIKIIDERKNLLKELEHNESFSFSKIEQWNHSCECWVEAYKSCYTECHNNFYGSSQYDANYDHFESLVFDHGYLKEKTTQVKPCTRDMTQELKTKPFCRCHLNLKTPFTEESHQSSFEELLHQLKEHQCSEQYISMMKLSIENTDWKNAIKDWEVCYHDIQQKEAGVFSLNKSLASYNGKTMTKKEFLSQIEEELSQYSTHFIRIES